MLVAQNDHAGRFAHGVEKPGGEMDVHHGGFVDHDDVNRQGISGPGESPRGRGREEPLVNGAALHLPLALGTRLVLRENFGELRKEPAADAHPHRLIHAARRLPRRRRERNPEAGIFFEEALENLRDRRRLPRARAARNDGKRLGDGHLNRLLLEAVGARGGCNPVDRRRARRWSILFWRLLSCEAKESLREQ